SAPLPVCPGTMSSIIMPLCRAAVAVRFLKSASDPKSGSIFVLIRSKCPSILRVVFQPRMPPARFIGPVCIPSIPISSKNFHNSSLLNADRADSFFLAINDIGYAVYQTDARAIAARGCGLAYGLRHMWPLPESFDASLLAPDSIDSFFSQLMYMLLDATGNPSRFSGLSGLVASRRARDKSSSG